jgi:CRISPR system Cascade subunit CasA
MSHPSFDLTREPWIPCEMLDGRRVTLGLQDVLSTAHELSAVHDESPLATAMIHRVLLAVLHRVVDGPHSQGQWEALWSQRRFDRDRIDAYILRWRPRFDLFHRDHPFLQVPRLADVLKRERPGKALEVLPIRRLALECSRHSGAACLLEHGGDEQHVEPGAAVRAMLGFLGFDHGGRIFNDSGYPQACPLRRGAVVVARGGTLRETLLLNLLVLGHDWPVPASKKDAPVWEAAVPPVAGIRPVHGWLDALTWTPRRVELLPVLGDRGVSVAQVITAAGAEPQGDWTEPMHALVMRDPKRGPEAVRFDPERSLWRDSTALFASTGQANYRRPAACSQIAKLVEADVLERGRLFTIDLYGLASSQAAIELWRAERMPLPVKLLTDPERLNVVQAGLAVAEEIGEALRRSAWLLASTVLAPGDRAPDKDDIRALTERLAADAYYWAALDESFAPFLRDASHGPDPEPTLGVWKKAAADAARRALAAASAGVGTQARALQASALAERHLVQQLSRHVPAPIERSTEEARA